MMNPIYNARITLMGTALINLGVAGIAALLVNGTAGDFAHIATWVTVGVDLIAKAQMVFGRLRT